MKWPLTLLLVAACTGTADLETQPQSPLGSPGGGGPDADASAPPDAGSGPGGEGGGAPEDDGGGAVEAADAGVEDAGRVDAGGQVADAGTGDAGAPNPCAQVQCSFGAHCLHGACACDPGFIADAGACIAGDPGVPALRSQQQVCDAWAAGHVVLDAHPFSKTTATCDPGVLTRQGLDDTLTRLNMHRYLAGLGPTTDNLSDDDAAQACALISASNPPGPQAHFPPPTAKCYTAAGASAAGSSNIAWGYNAAGSIDGWMIDSGNESTFGHRRWLLHPPLGPVGFGYYGGGSGPNQASCLKVFGSSGHGPRPSFIAYPPPGFVPLQAALWKWTVQGDVPSSGVAVQIHDSTGAQLDAGVVQLQGSYGYSNALRIDQYGWVARAGETYHVSLTAQGHAPIEYDVKPVNCP